MSENRNFTFLSKIKAALSSGIVLVTGILLASAGVILAQTAANKTLVVNGNPVGAVVREIDGHTYIQVEALARAMSGSVTIDPDRVLLTIPVTVSAPAASVTTAASGPVTHGLSTDFKRAAIAELSNMREWRGAVGAMITYGLAASDQTAKDYHDVCEDGMNQASVSAVTDADRNAARLLKNEFDNMAAWANQILAERKALNGARTVSPSLQQNDRALASITACGRFLNTMIVGGVFNDDGSCH